jgi:hypothetical protein
MIRSLCRPYSEYLEKSFVERDSEMIFLKFDPQLDLLRDDPQFEALLERMNLK